MKQPELDIGTRKDYAIVCIQTAKENLDEAQLLYQGEHFGGAANRIYNCVFRSIMAVHNLDGHSFRNHKDALGQFNKLYLKDEIFPRRFGPVIYDIQSARHKSDYGYNQAPSKAVTEEYLSFAQEFYHCLKSYCEQKIGYPIDV